MKLRNNVEEDLETLHYSSHSVDLNPSTTHIARTLIATGNTSHTDLYQVMKNIQDKMVKEVDHMRQRMIDHKRTMNLFSINKEEQRKHSINFYNLSLKLGKIKKDHEDYDGKIEEIFANQKFLKEIEILESEEFKSIKPLLVYEQEEEEEDVSN